jgi:glycosyltransferase involved in cell wall biosynthesis
MKLDVVVPTYNRSGLLRTALLSLLKAPVPAGLEVTVFVVDNNSVDDTAQVVAEMAENAALPVRYVREKKQGLSHSRNAGIAAGTGDLVGFIDDDEEIEEHWYEVIAREFSDPATEFIGGPYLPNWVSPVPDWLPPGYHAAIGAVPPKPRAVFSPDFGANLMGGNAVIRRDVFERVGGYSTRLGRSGKGLLSEEDAEFYRRMEKVGIRGIYTPDLRIYHYIAPERLTRNYHRRWAYWRAVSQGILDREQRQPVQYLCGIPRHRIGRAVRGLLALPLHRLGSDAKGQAFADELAGWDLAGFVYGKHFIRIESLYTSNGPPEEAK